MITVSKQENGVLFTFQNSDKYLYGSGTIEVPFNSLSIIQDESDNITLRKSASNDIFLSARYDTDFGYASKEAAVEALKEILYDEAGISEEEVQQMIDAATSGIPSSEVVEQLRRDVNAVSGEVDTKQDILTAGENITISGNVISADAGNNIIELTQAEYDALETKDPEALYIITDAQEINMNDYYTKSEVYNKQEVDAAYGTAYQTLTAHTANTEVHVTQAEKNTWNGKLDTSAYTPTDLSEYWTSGQTQEAINAATSGIPSSQVIEALRNDINTVSGDVENKQDALEYYSEAEYPDGGGGRGMINVYNGKRYFSSVEADAGTTDGGTYARLSAQGEAGSNTLKVSPSGVTINDAKVLTENDINPDDIWDTIDEKEEVIASALTQLNQDVSAIDAKEEVIASALTEVNQALNNKLDASAYTPTDLSEYWTSEQTQTAINAATSGKADTSAVTAVNGALTTHTADTTVHVSQAEKDIWNAKADASAITSIESAVTTLSGAVIDNEYTVSQAINELKSTKLDASAYTPTDLSQYWTSAQTQTAINAKQDALTAGSGISISNNVISTSGVVMSQNVTQIVKLTQAAYDALTTKDNQTLYIVVD